MSDALIASLNEQISRLQQENATIRAEAKDRRLKAKVLREENERYAAAIEELAKERDTLKARAEAEPGELQTELDKVRGQLRDRDHRDKFRDLAKAAGVTQSKALDDLWTISGYKAEADQIDEPKITAAITGALEGRDWLKAAPAAEAANGTGSATPTQTAQAAAPATLSAGPGATRGGASKTGDPDQALRERFPNAYRIA